MLVAVQLSVPGLYLPPVFKKYLIIPSAPDDHLAAGPDCRMIVSRRGALVVLVAVQLSVPGLYLPPVFNGKLPIKSAPDDHFTTSPDCRVNRVGHLARWIVLVAVQTVW